MLPIESHIGKELGVSMVCWSQDDSRIITADKDLAIKVWDSTSGTLLHVLKVGFLTCGDILLIHFVRSFYCHFDFN